MGMSLVSAVQVCVKDDLKLSPASARMLGEAFSASPVTCLQRPLYAKSCWWPGAVRHRNLVDPPLNTSSCDAQLLSVLLARPPICHLRSGFARIGVSKLALYALLVLVPKLAFAFRLSAPPKIFLSTTFKYALPSELPASVPVLIVYLPLSLALIKTAWSVGEVEGSVWSGVSM
jgi:hypothetical protein